MRGWILGGPQRKKLEPNDSTNTNRLRYSRERAFQSSLSKCSEWPCQGACEVLPVVELGEAAEAMYDEIERRPEDFPMDLDRLW